MTPSTRARQFRALALLAVSLYAWQVAKNMDPAEAKRLTRAMLPGRGLEE